MLLITVPGMVTFPGMVPAGSPLQWRRGRGAGRRTRRMLLMLGLLRDGGERNEREDQSQGGTRTAPVHGQDLSAAKE